MKLSTVLAVTAFLSVVPLHASNLVLNPGFESGDLTSWTLNQAPQGSDIIVSGPANTGSFSVGFGATAVGSYDSISQSLTTAIGQTYNLGFFLASIFEGTGDFLPERRTIVSSAALDPSGDFQAFWNGTMLLDLTLSSQTTLAFSQFSFAVQGTGSDTLLFRGYNLPSFYRLDDVSLNAAAAPEPATWAAMGIGLAALLAVRSIRLRAAR